MITQENDESVLKKQKSDHKWLIIFLGKVCSVSPAYMLPQAGASRSSKG